LPCIIRSQIVFFTVIRSFAVTALWVLLGPKHFTVASLSSVTPVGLRVGERNARRRHTVEVDGDVDDTLVLLVSDQYLMIFFPKMSCTDRC